MRRRFHGNIAILLMVGANLGACAQSTRHSNTMIFGTNTAFGLNAGQDVSGIPSVTVGYRRQEAVVMPLVANTSDDGTFQTPCPVQSTIDLPPGQRHPCLLVSVNAEGAIDTYSVLASFGAEFGGAANPTESSASGGLAQFFATGNAAQALAIRGGSSLVAVSEASREAALQNTDSAIAALYDAPVVLEEGTRIRGTAAVSRTALANFIEGQTTDATFSGKLANVERAAGVAAGTLANGLCRGQARSACLIRAKSDAGLRFTTLYSVDWKAAVDQVLAGGGS